MPNQFRAALKLLGWVVLLNGAPSLWAAELKAARSSASGVTSVSPATASVAATALKVLARSEDAKFVGSKG